MKTIVAFIIAAFASFASAQDFYPTMRAGVLGFYFIDNFATDGRNYYHDGSIVVTGSRSTGNNTLATGVWGFDRTLRTRFTSATAINQTAGFVLSNPANTGGSLWIGPGGTPRQGGFRYVVRSGIASAATALGQGVGALWVLAMLTQDLTITTTNDPSGEVTNAFYVGLDKGETILEACSCGAAPPCACTQLTDLGAMVDLGAHIYDIEFDCTLGIPCSYSVMDVVTGTTVEGTFSANAADNPATNAFFDERAYCATGAVAQRCSFDLSQVFALRSY